MKRKITLALSFSMLTLALAANPYSALAIHKGPDVKINPTAPPPPPPPPPSGSKAVSALFGAIYAVLFL
jgi:hypothetical protein